MAVIGNSLMSFENILNCIFIGKKRNFFTKVTEYTYSEDI